jgi:hypothetical protein
MSVIYNRLPLSVARDHPAVDRPTTGVVGPPAPVVMRPAEPSWSLYDAVYEIRHSGRLQLIAPRRSSPQPHLGGV